MAIEKMVDVLHRSKATPRAKLVLLGIANHEGENGAYPSIKTLAKYANCSERSVKRDIQELVELGELIVKNQGAPVASQYRPNLYFTNVSGVTDRHPWEASGVTAQVSRGDSLGTLNVREPSYIKTTDTKTCITKKISTHINPDFKPEADSWQLMEEHFPHIDLKLETHSFIDYWTSRTGSGSMKKDWDATWRNWIRSAHKRMMQNGNYKKQIEQQKREEEIRKLYENSGD
jgi:hypothetical protein